MKDIKELRIKINPHWRKYVPYNTLALGKSNGSKCEQGFVKHAKFQCPITSADFNGSKQFFGIWCCGHTISRAHFVAVMVDCDCQLLRMFVYFLLKFHAPNPTFDFLGQFILNSYVTKAHLNSTLYVY